MKAEGERLSARIRRISDRVAPVLTVCALVVVVWYAAALAMNWSLARDAFERAEVTPTTGALVAATMDQPRPLLPAPHQIVAEFAHEVFGYPVDSNRSLVLHAGVTLEAGLLGFALGVAAGVLLATAIAYSRTLERSLLPWIIASQMVPVLAIAPITIVVLGSLGLRGLVPKALISAYLSFFPVVIGMVKGLNSPDQTHRDLMRTWSAGGRDILFKLRAPASTPFFFASLKVAAAVALVGAIVAELPTGAQAGIGARLLAGSYYGQTLQIWAALVAGAVLAAALAAAIGLVERVVALRMGERR